MNLQWPIAASCGTTAHQLLAAKHGGSTHGHVCCLPEITSHPLHVLLARLAVYKEGKALPGTDERSD